MSDLEEALARIIEFLDSNRIPYMVIGGLANIVWGEPRTTADIDITVDLSPVGLGSFGALVSEVGVPLIEDHVAFAERNRVMPVRTPEGTIVDFVLATLPFESEAISRATETQIGSVEARVCGPQDLVIHKIVSERPRDHEDVIGIFRRSRGSINFEELDAFVDALASELEDPEIAQRYRSAKDSAGIE